VVRASRSPEVPHGCSVSFKEPQRINEPVSSTATANGTTSRGDLSQRDTRCSLKIADLIDRGTEPAQPVGAMTRVFSCATLARVHQSKPGCLPQRARRRLSEGHRANGDRDHTDIDPAGIGTNQRRGDAGACSEGVGVAQDLGLGGIDDADGAPGAILFGCEAGDMLAANAAAVRSAIGIDYECSHRDRQHGVIQSKAAP